ncbi:hypothetical protein V7166_23135 [Bacillus thuringiensis]
MLTKKDKTEQLALLADKARLVSGLSFIALNLLEDEMYTREQAAEDLIKIVDEETEFIPKVSC